MLAFRQMALLPLIDKKGSGAPKNKLLEMKMRYLIFAILFLALQIIACSTLEVDEVAPAEPEPLNQEVVTGAQQADVQLNKATFAPGEEIEILALGTGFGDEAWLGIVPVDTDQGSEAENRERSLSIISLDTEGVLVLSAPLDPGEYEVRLNDGDHELAKRSFVVSSEAAEP